MGESIWVEVAYARPDTQEIRPVDVPAGATLETAIRRSGILDRFPEIDLAVNHVGVFGKRRALDDRLEPGDRVEIYRELIADPKEARRKRAAKKRPAAGKGGPGLSPRRR